MDYPPSFYGTLVWMRLFLPFQFISDLKESHSKPLDLSVPDLKRDLGLNRLAGLKLEASPEKKTERKQELMDILESADNSGAYSKVCGPLVYNPHFWFKNKSCKPGIFSVPFYLLYINWEK